MKIESITVEVLRQGEAYTNDKLSVRVAIEDGEDWRSVEAVVRDEAVKSIEGHWERNIARAETERKANGELDIPF